MADLGSGSSSSKTKNLKKRARKKLKKAEEAGHTSATIAGDEEDEEGEGGGGGGEEEIQLIADPVAELKKRLDKAKHNQDHETAQKLREELWKLRDNILTPSDLGIATATDVTNSAISLQTSSVLQSAAVASSDPLDKKISKLKRKLKQIEALEERQTKGEKLEANQLTKISAKQEVVDEISELEEIISGT